MSRRRVVPTAATAQPQGRSSIVKRLLTRGPRGATGAGQSVRNLLQLLDARDMAAFVDSDLVEDMTVGELAEQLRDQSSPQSVTELQLAYSSRVREHWATGNAELYSLLAKRFNKKGETLMALDVLREGQAVQPKNSTITRTLALTLARVGETPEAMKVLNDMIKNGIDDVPDETHGILARCHKDLADRAASEEQERHHLQEAREIYYGIFDKGGRKSYYTGINAASMTFLTSANVSGYMDLAGEVLELEPTTVAVPASRSASRSWEIDGACSRLKRVSVLGRNG